MKGPDTLWELIFIMVILKIPIAYLCYVVWYAIKAEPRGRGGPAGVREAPGLAAAELRPLPPAVAPPPAASARWPCAGLRAHGACGLSARG